jgi:hypothetical protein
VEGSLAPTDPGVVVATLVPAATTQAAFGPDLPRVDVTLQQVTPSIARVRLGAPGRWAVPRDVFGSVPPPPPDAATADPTFDLETLADPFAVRVRRSGEEEAIFDTSGHRLVMKDMYLEVSTALPPSARVYGLGESTSTTGMLLPRDG